jgi:hypothetical protein
MWLSLVMQGVSKNFRNGIPITNCPSIKVLILSRMRVKTFCLCVTCARANADELCKHCSRRICDLKEEGKWDVGNSKPLAADRISTFVTYIARLAPYLVSRAMWLVRNTQETRQHFLSPCLRIQFLRISN